VAVALAGGYGITRAPDLRRDGGSARADSDHDGLADRIEESGWVIQGGAEFHTDPHLADTDKDGLTDGDEAGGPVTHAQAEFALNGRTGFYVGYSNPLIPDSDGDGLSDADEADLSLDPGDRDTDHDGLDDMREVEVIGSAPDVADTDGDGFEDGYEVANRESQGLNPSWPDVKVSRSDYVIDFAKGAVLGDLDREDSLAWLAGNLAAGGSSAIPVVGWVVGGVADVRDAIGSAIHADWVGSGFSAVGVVPDLGDAVAIPGKAAKFVARNPELAAATAAITVGFTKVPEAIKVRAAKLIWKDWDNLRSAGASDKALLQLEKGRTNLDELAATVARPGHVQGHTAKFFSTGYAGEAWLEGIYSATVSGATKQVSASTKGCLLVCNLVRRRFDVLVDGVAHESKVGRVPWSPSVERQIRSDAWLIETGQIEGAHWDFMASSVSNTIGANPKVLDLLDEVGIPYTIHLPG
jgi:hypothetical protein